MQEEAGKQMKDMVGEDIAETNTQGEKVIFLDRDGTLNVEVSYLHRTEDLEMIDGAAEAVRQFNEAGYQVVVVTNQAGVARGYYTEEDVVTLNQYMNQVLSRSGAHVDAFYYCPHHPAHGIGRYKISCECRKPGTGMFEEAGKQFKNGINKEESYMIGDKLLDTQAGHNYGVKSILVGTGYGGAIRKKQSEEGLLDENGCCRDQSYDYYAENLLTAAKIILEPKQK